jgi:hypothetical protein
MEETEGQSGADVDVVFGEGANIAGSFVVVNDICMVGTGEKGGWAEGSKRTEGLNTKHRRLVQRSNR